MNFYRLRPLAIGLVLLIALSAVAIAGETMVESELTIDTQPGRYTVVSDARGIAVGDNLVVAGNLQRRHFTPRRPLQGQVWVAVHDAAGNTLHRELVPTTDHFVPKGLRQTGFSVELQGPFPAGAKVTLTPVR